MGAIAQPTSAADPDRWDWCLRAYYVGGEFAIETVHRGVASKDIELSAFERRTAKNRSVVTSGRSVPPIDHVDIFEARGDGPKHPGLLRQSTRRWYLVESKEWKHEPPPPIDCSCSYTETGVPFPECIDCMVHGEDAPTKGSIWVHFNNGMRYVVDEVVKMQTGPSKWAVIYHTEHQRYPQFDPEHYVRTLDDWYFRSYETSGEGYPRRFTMVEPER